MEKYGFVYIWLDRKHKRYYVGSHWGTIDDGYICSSRWMNLSYKKRPYDFKRRIITKIYTCKKDMFEEEYRFLQMIKTEEIKKRYYNLNRGAINHYHGNKDSKKIYEKISATLKEKHKDPEYRKIYEAGQAKIDRTPSEETIQKRRESMKKTLAEKFSIEKRKKSSPRGSEEHSKKLSEAAIRRWGKPDAKEKQAAITSSFHTGKQWRLGHKNTHEHTEKIRQANIGKKRSPEQVEKMRQTKLGTKATLEQRIARSIKTKEMWAARRAGLLPMPNYNKYTTTS